MIYLNLMTAYNADREIHTICLSIFNEKIMPP